MEIFVKAKMIREREPKSCLESDSMKMKLQLGERTPNLSMDNEILIPNIWMESKNLKPGWRVSESAGRV